MANGEVMHPSGDETAEVDYVLGEQPYGVPGERGIKAEDPIQDDETFFAQLQSETAAAVAGSLRGTRKVFSVMRGAPGKMRLFVGEHPHEVVGGVAVAIVVTAAGKAIFERIVEPRLHGDAPDRPKQT